MSFLLRRPRTELVTSIDADMRRYVEHRRLLRMIDAISHEPSDAEMKRLVLLLKKVQPQTTSRALGMSGLPLSDANKEHLDVAGYGSLQPVGVHCQMARVTTLSVRFTPADANGQGGGELVFTEQPAPAPVAPDAEPMPHARADTMLFMTDDGKVRAIDRVLVQQEGNQIVLDGCLALRKLVVTEEERMRVNSAHNVLDSDYLAYYTFADEEAVRAGVDIVGDAHQRRYDANYELVYVVSDCLLVHTRQINKPYLHRITLVHNLTEMPVAQSTTTGFRRRMQSISNLVAYAGGYERLQLTIFMRPFWSVKHARAAMHAVPNCLQGMAISGVVFTPNDAAYTVGALNDRLLHYSKRPTAWLLATGADRTISALEQGAAAVVRLNTLLVDTPLARRLVGTAPVDESVQRVFECEPVPDEGTEQGGMSWRPINRCPTRTRPESLAAVQSVHATCMMQHDEELFVDWLLKEHVGAKQGGE